MASPPSSKPQDAKIDELIALCDNVKAKRQKIDDLAQIIASQEPDIEKIEKKLAEILTRIEKDEQKTASLRLTMSDKKDGLKKKTDNDTESLSTASAGILWKEPDVKLGLRKLKAMQEVVGEIWALLHDYVELESMETEIAGHRNSELLPVQAQLKGLRTKKEEAEKEMARLSKDLDETLAKFNTGSDIPDVTLSKTAFDKGYAKGIADKSAQMNALQLVGAETRSKKLEYTTITPKDAAIIERGNAAVHYGRVLADSILYLSAPHPYKRTDIGSFTTLYGVSPSFVDKHRCCKELIEILDWHCSMRNFHNFKLSLGPVASTNFHKVLDPMLKDLLQDEEATTETIRTYIQNHKTEFQTLKREHDEALKKHQEYRRTSG